MTKKWKSVLTKRVGTKVKTDYKKKPLRDSSQTNKYQLHNRLFVALLIGFCTSLYVALASAVLLICGGAR